MQLNTTPKPCPIDVIISYGAHRKLMAYINNVANEVGGLGKITRSGNFIHIDDVYLLEQRVTGASTDLSPEGIAKFYQERLQVDPADNLGGYKLWWHSHYNFGVFWSGTDEATVNSFDQETEIDNFMLSLVGNQKGEIKIRLDIYSPFRYTFDNIEYIIGADDSDFEEEIKKEIEAKVKGTPDYVTPTSNDIDLFNEDWDKPDNWQDLTKKERKWWRKANKEGKTLASYSWVGDKDGKFHKGMFAIPKGTVIVGINEHCRPIYIYKQVGETDEQAKLRYIGFNQEPNGRDYDD